MSAWFVRMIGTNCATVAMVSLRMSIGRNYCAPSRWIGRCRASSSKSNGSSRERFTRVILRHLGFALTLPKAAHGSMASISFR